MRHPTLLFLDCETLGLEKDAPIWEIAAIRVEGNRRQEEPPKIHNRVTVWSGFVQHDSSKADSNLPYSYREDYEQRFDPYFARGIPDALEVIRILADGAVVCGSNPWFDMDLLKNLAIANDVDPEFGWHYHPIDVPTLVHGWLLGKGVTPAPPWKSDLLSQVIGVDPTSFDRHTAKGDALWCKEMWEKVTR